MNVQPLEQPSTQKACCLIKGFLRTSAIAGEQAVKHFGMCVVGCDFHRLNGDHAYAWVLQFARDKFRQIALDLVGHLKGAVGRGGLLRSHGFFNSALQRACDFLDVKELQLITFFDVVVVLELDTALKAFFDFSYVVFQTTQRFDFAGVDHHVLAQ